MRTALDRLDTHIRFHLWYENFLDFLECIDKDWDRWTKDLEEAKRFLKKAMRQDELMMICIEWMRKQERLTWEYIRDGYEEECDYDYDKLSQCDWFNQIEHDEFYEHFIEPFFEEHTELNPDDDDVFEVVEETLRDEMYNQDKYECIIL